MSFKERNLTLLWCGYNGNTVFTRKLHSLVGSTLKMKQHFTLKKPYTCSKGTTQVGF